MYKVCHEEKSEFTLEVNNALVNWTCNMRHAFPLKGMERSHERWVYKPALSRSYRENNVNNCRHDAVCSPLNFTFTGKDGESPRRAIDSRSFEPSAKILSAVREVNYGIRFASRANYIVSLLQWSLKQYYVFIFKTSRDKSELRVTCKRWRELNTLTAALFRRL